MTSKFLTVSLSKIVAANKNKPSSLLLASSLSSSSSKYVRKLATAVPPRVEDSYGEDFFHRIVFGEDSGNVLTTGTIASATTTSNCPPSFIVLDGDDRRVATFTPSQRFSNNSSLELYGSPLYYFSTESQQQQSTTSTLPSTVGINKTSSSSKLSEPQEEEQKTMKVMEEYPVLGTWIHQYGFFRQQQQEEFEQQQQQEENEEEDGENQSFMLLA